MRTKTIHESLNIDNRGNATSKQEITYYNIGNEPLEFSGVHETIFHSRCHGFHFEANTGPIIPHLLPLESEPYQKRFRYELTGSIPPGCSAKLVLNYEWASFRNDAGMEKIATQFDSLTSYKVQINSNDNTFTDHLISVYDGENLLDLDHDYYVTQNGHLIITRQHLSPNSRMSINVRARIKKINLPVVDDIANQYAGCIKDNLVCLTIIHLLRDSLPFFNALLSLGTSKDDLYIIGIPYSSKEEVVEHLRESGFKVYNTRRDFYLTEFNDLVKKALTDACAHCADSGKRLLIIEDGGYAVPLLHEAEFQDYVDLCFGAVEQTANGIWADKKIEEAGRLSFPVMNVAESRIKKERESPLVGRAIFQNINRLLEGYGFSITSQKIGQIGFGTIGEPLARQIMGDGASIAVYDLAEEKRDRARDAGFEVADNLENLFPNKTLIIGCTGQEIVGLDQLRSLNKSVFFVNATSKLRELKYKEFLRSTQRIKSVRGSGTEYRLKGGKQVTIRLLADGFPVNFFENSESIPDREIQFIPALLISAAAYLVNNKISEHKIIPIPESLEKQLEELISLYDETQ